MIKQNLISHEVYKGPIRDRPGSNRFTIQFPNQKSFTIKTDKSLQEIKEKYSQAEVS